MVTHLLIAGSLIYAALIYLRPLTWWQFKLHFAALETCLVGAALGVCGLFASDGFIERALALPSSEPEQRLLRRRLQACERREPPPHW